MGRVSFRRGWVWGVRRRKVGGVRERERERGKDIDTNLGCAVVSRQENIPGCKISVHYLVAVEVVHSYTDRVRVIVVWE